MQGRARIAKLIPPSQIEERTSVKEKDIGGLKPSCQLLSYFQLPVLFGCFKSTRS